MTQPTGAPTTAYELVSGSQKGRDSSFLLLAFDATANKLTVGRDFPIALNMKPEERDAAGLNLPTRNEFSKGQAGPQYDGYRTGASGAAVWVYGAGSAEPRILLLQNSLDKPVNPGRYNFLSGLLTTGIKEQAFIETNEEGGLFVVDRQNKILRGLNMNMFAGDDSLSQQFRNAVFDVRGSQEANIRIQLSIKHPEFAEWPIVWDIIDVKTIAGNSNAVTLDMFGTEEVVYAHVLEDTIAKSVNVHFPVSLTLPEDAEVIAVDPEKFGRNAGLYTLGQARQLDTIPAPNDYLQKLEL